MNATRPFAAAVLSTALFALAVLAGCARPAPSSASVESPVTQHLPPSRWQEDQVARIRGIMQSTVRGAFLDSAGIAIADEGGRVLYARNSERTYAPASTMKTIVGATALATLGTRARLDTSLVSLDAPDPEGQIDDLWLVGSGDPLLDPEQLRGGIGALAQLGVRRIDGDLIVDATSFKGPEQNPAWSPDDFEWGYAAGTSAISLNWDVIEFRVTPTQIGAAARLGVFPADPSITIRGTVTTGYGTTLRIDRLVPGRNVFKVSGTIAAGGEQSFYRPALGIPQWAGDVAAEMLHERGIELSGRVRLGPDPVAGKTLWSHRSPSLDAMVKQMLFESDNHIAEQLLRVLGSQTDGPPGTTDGTTLAGARVERAYLANLGVATPGLRIVDASGLAESNRVAPLTFVELLSAVGRSAIGTVYVSSLPRAGMEGTVRYHDLNAALGRVHAKSGHIAGVNTLVGYVQTRTRGWLTFAFLANGPDADDATLGGIDRALDGLSLL